VGNGNNDVGRKTPTRKTSPPVVQMGGGGSSDSRIDQKLRGDVATRKL
jgi:hypothetical protein